MLPTASHSAWFHVLRFPVRRAHHETSPARTLVGVMGFDHPIGALTDPPRWDGVDGSWPCPICRLARSRGTSQADASQHHGQ